MGFRVHESIMLLVEVTFFVLIRMSDDSSEKKKEAFSLFFLLPFPSIITITSREDSLQWMNRSTLVSWFSLLDKKYPRYFYLVFDSGWHKKKMLLATAAFDPKILLSLVLLLISLHCLSFHHSFQRTAGYKSNSTLPEVQWLKD